MIDKELESLIDNELSFWYKNEKLYVPSYVSDSIKDMWDTFFNEFYRLTSLNKDFTIYTTTEILNHEHLDKIIQLIDESNCKIKISFATSTKFKHSFHPLTNLSIHWFRQRMRTNISWDNSQPKISVLDKKYFSGFKKSIKGILSVRKQIEWRDWLFSKLNENEFDGIFRYAKWIRNANDETEDIISQKDNFPTYLELLREYKKSYVSFVVESSSESDFLNYLTEKTLIAFLTKTIPVVIGGKDYVKELKDIGFYVWNNEFGFEDGDSIEHPLNRVDNYIKCINKFNLMTYTDVETLYNDNIDKINHNYNLASKYIWSEYSII